MYFLKNINMDDDNDDDDDSSTSDKINRSLHFQLHTMKELEECFSNIISGKFLRRRTHSLGTVSSASIACPGHSNPRLQGEACPAWSSNSDMLCSSKIHPVPPIVTSLSESKSTKKTMYHFFCKNASSNLETIIQDGMSTENDDILQKCRGKSLQVYDTDFDINDRIIPQYYIGKDVIKVGALQFNFSDSIVDSIRNMRTLSKYQLLYLDRYSREELKQLILEYNTVIEKMVDNIPDI